MDPGRPASGVAAPESSIITEQATRSSAGAAGSAPGRFSIGIALMTQYRSKFGSIVGEFPTNERFEPSCS